MNMDMLPICQISIQYCEKQRVSNEEALSLFYFYGVHRAYQLRASIRGQLCVMLLLGWSMEKKPRYQMDDIKIWVVFLILKTAKEILFLEF